MQTVMRALSMDTWPNVERTEAMQRMFAGKREHSQIPQKH
ncbi:hypothetical protein BLA6863_00558 [Burkholderia lata]|uniref:Uncharacterized protein n=1 Tax=Burkholderia lata (strain ATCC 17760 / DSM 23089 / LMG 22485 / NCIMB 9086 / R18194 / 383) TaxID=482957 RepID=A0A6P2HCX0_BURL3|nr:hypothetical protein BLA6863_00558 [Burkholderia lata]